MRGRTKKKKMEWERKKNIKKKEQEDVRVI